MAAERAQSRLLIGYWHDRTPSKYSHPQALVDRRWEPERRAQIVEYLKSGSSCAYSGGVSYCRFGCTQEWLKLADDAPGSAQPGSYVPVQGPLWNGTALFCDDEWCWPEGLAHYVEQHGVRLPDEFVAHAAQRGFRPTPVFKGSVAMDDSFWVSWCNAHAPFAYEPNCRTCASAAAPAR